MLVARRVKQRIRRSHPEPAHPAALGPGHSAAAVVQAVSQRVWQVTLVFAPSSHLYPLCHPRRRSLPPLGPPPRPLFAPAAPLAHTPVGQFPGLPALYSATHGCPYALLLVPAYSLSGLLGLHRHSRSSVQYVGLRPRSTLTNPETHARSSGSRTIVQPIGSQGL